MNKLLQMLTGRLTPEYAKKVLSQVFIGVVFRQNPTDRNYYFIERNEEPIGLMNSQCIGVATHPVGYPPDALLMQKFEFGKSSKRAFKSFITKNKLGDPLWTAHYKAGLRGTYL